MKTGKKFWIALVLFGLVGQVAWVVENMYLNVFIYKMFHASAAQIAMMVSASAVAAALTTILMGALSVVSFTNGLHIAFIVVFATLLALLGCATYIVIYNIRKCATLKKQFLLICDS